MKIFRFLLSLIFCGTGHILKKDYFKGLSFFSIFLGSLALIYFALNIQGILSIFLLISGISLGIFIWLYSLIDLLSNNKIKKKRAKVKEDHKDNYIKAISYYLKGDFGNSINMFKFIFKKNSRDPDVIYQMAKSYMSGGDKNRAKKLAKRYLRFETQGKWAKEAKEILQS